MRLSSTAGIFAATALGAGAPSAAAPTESQFLVETAPQSVTHPLTEVPYGPLAIICEDSPCDGPILRLYPEDSDNRGLEEVELAGDTHYHFHFHLKR